MASPASPPRTPTRATGSIRFDFASAASPTQRSSAFSLSADEAATHHFFPVLFEWTQPDATTVGITGSFNKCVECVYGVWVGPV